jgi:hypothetical protein
MLEKRIRAYRAIGYENEATEARAILAEPIIEYEFVPSSD